MVHTLEQHHYQRSDLRRAQRVVLHGGRGARPPAPAPTSVGSGNIIEFLIFGDKHAKKRVRFANKIQTLKHLGPEIESVPGIMIQGIVLGGKH